MNDSKSETDSLNIWKRFSTASLSFPGSSRTSDFPPSVILSISYCVKYWINISTFGEIRLFFSSRESDISSYWIYLLQLGVGLVSTFVCLVGWLTQSGRSHTKCIKKRLWRSPDFSCSALHEVDRLWLRLKFAAQIHAPVGMVCYKCGCHNSARRLADCDQFMVSPQDHLDQISMTSGSNQPQLYLLSC